MTEAAAVSHLHGPLYAGLAGWNCWLTADTPAGRDMLQRTFRSCQSDQPARVSSGICVSVRTPGPPRLRLISGGRGFTLDQLMRGPEWKRFARLPHPSRNLFVDTILGGEPALEITGGELLVLQPDRWPIYAQMGFLGLLLHECPCVSLHAAVLASNGTALVLIGSSGCGKSTLSWALHERGADYFGDEVAVFTVPQYELYVLSRELYLRPDGLCRLESPPGGDWHEMKPGDPKCVVTPPPPRAPCPRDRAVLFFMDGFSDEPELNPLGGGAAARRILRSMGCRDESIGARLELAAGLVDRYPCWSLIAGPPEVTATAVLAHLSEREA
nr:hypothetical protein Hi04_10k_c1889_00029 [uncultured bacterium]